MRSHGKAPSAALVESPGGFRRALLALLLIAAACAVLATSVDSASAATPSLSYGYASDIGTSAGGGGVGSFNAVATSDDGDVFIVRQNNADFEILDSSGAPVAQPSAGFALPYAMAASADGASVYVADAYAFLFGFGSPIHRYTSDGASPPNYTQDTSWEPDPASNIGSVITGLAVDPVTGDVLVANGLRVSRFDGTSGALLSSFDGSTAQLGKFTNQSPAFSLAVAPNRDIYVIVGVGRVEHFGADGSWKGSLDVPVPEEANPPSGIAVNPQNGDVAVELPQGADTVIKVYSAAGDPKETIRVPPWLQPANTALAYAADGSKLYIARNDGTAHVFALGTRPGVDPPTAAEITTTSASLSSTVATGGESSTARIEYCLASDPCNRYLASTSGDPSDLNYDPALDPNSGSYDPSKTNPWVRLPLHPGLSSPVQDTISDELSGLEPNTKYLVKTYAVNDAGNVEGISSTGSFTTAVVPPELQAVTASGITDTSADLSGTIDTIGAQTTYRFEYGLTASYGGRVPANADAIAGSSRTPRTFTQSLTGLQPETTYHYRLVATNSAGTTFGSDQTFVTLGSGQVPPRRAYEQVTSPQKNGMSLYSNWGFQASKDGSAMVYSASEAPSDALGSPLASRYLASREAGGWNGQKPLDPPLAPTRGILEATVQGVSDDFEHTFVLSQEALAPGATKGAANIYVNDLETGAFHLVGIADGPAAYNQLTGPSSMNTFIAGAPDFSWVVLISRYPMLPDAPQVAMYKWSRTEGLSIVSLLGTNTLPSGDVWAQGSVSHVNNLVSDDGETFAYSLTNGEGGVYRRSGGQTVPISIAQQSGGPAGTQPGQVDGMSTDGRFVVFHSNVQLTDDSSEPGTRMYRYDAQSGQLEYLGLQGNVNEGGPDVLGISEDAGTVYFNTNSQAVIWRQGQPGLDVVAQEPLRSSTYGYPSPNGDYFAFRPADGSAYLYEVATGEARCISCTPAEPGGDGAPGESKDRLLSNRFPQVVTDDGHAFFTSSAPLIAADHNATSDVYEYFEGRLALISPGDGDFAATLADITPDGRNVFFTTAEGIVPRDTDGTYDIYDARVGGGFPEALAPPADCAGEACRGSAAAPPSMANVGSSAVKKSGSPKQPRVRCRKGTHKIRKNGKTRCVKNKHPSKSSRETKHNREAGR